MKVHLKRKDAVYDDDQAYCGTLFHVSELEHRTTTKARKVTCRSCRKIWGKQLHEKLIERSLTR